MRGMFRGTLTRRQYALHASTWIVATILAGLLCSVVGMAGQVIAGTKGHMAGTLGAYAVVVLVSILAKSAIMTRRMRDAGISRWVLLLYWVPLLVSVNFHASHEGVGLDVNSLTILTLLLVEPFLLLRRGRSGGLEPEPLPA